MIKYEETENAKSLVTLLLLSSKVEGTTFHFKLIFATQPKLLNYKILDYVKKEKEAATLKLTDSVKGSDNSIHIMNDYINQIDKGNYLIE